MTEEHEKRPAGELAGGLLARTAYDPGLKRPASTVVGAVLVLLRVLAGLGVILTVSGITELLPIGQGPLIDLVVPDKGRPAALGFIVTAGFIILVAEAVLAVLIFLGHNWPRVTVMLFAVGSISFSFVAWRILGERIELEGTFVSLALDILILLALSSRSAASYARRNERQDA